jgi:hypothetical protein
MRHGHKAWRTPRALIAELVALDCILSLSPAIPAHTALIWLDVLEGGSAQPAATGRNRRQRSVQAKWSNAWSRSARRS